MNVCTAVAVFLMMCAVSSTSAPRKFQFERGFEYAWSRSAQWVVYGTISAVERIDEASQPAMYQRVTLRVDSVQRGKRQEGNVEVRIDAGTHSEEEAVAVGRHGLWFLHRVTEPAGKNPQAHLIRYMPSSEISNDLVYADELLQFVLQDTIDQKISRYILGTLEPGNVLKERHVEIELAYDGQGTLASMKVVHPSGNLLYDQHVVEIVVFILRDLNYPHLMQSALIQVTRRP